MIETCCLACWLIVVCFGAGSGASWRPKDNDDHHDWLMHEVPSCWKTHLPVLFLLFCCHRCHASFPNDVAAQTTRHNNQFAMEATASTAPMQMRMLIVTFSQGYYQSPGTKPYVFLRRSQPTTNSQYLPTRHDLNGRQQPPWCSTPGANTDNSRPECWRIVICGGAGSGAPWRQWEDGGRHGWQGN